LSPLGWGRFAAAVFGIAVAGWAGHVAAEQTAFSATPVGADLRLDYRFETRTGSAESLTFPLQRSAVDRARRAFARLDLGDLHRRLVNEQKALTAQVVDTLRHRYPDAQINRRGTGISWRVAAAPSDADRRDWLEERLATAVDALRRKYPRADITVSDDGSVRYAAYPDDMGRLDRDMRALLRRLKLEERQRLGEQERTLQRALESQSDAIQDDWNAAQVRTARQLQDIRTNYFRSKGYALDGNVGRPDYQSAARESVADLRPLAMALRERAAGGSVRDTVDLALQFFQAIPYDTLTSRMTSNGAGFAFPLAMLAENRGDCDTKSVAFAAVLKALFPSLSTVMVIVPGHALVGVDVPAAAGDRTLHANGRTYVLMEPVGPAQTRIGEVGEQSTGRMGRIDKVLRLF